MIVKVMKRGALAGAICLGLLQIAPANLIGVPTEEIGTNPPERFAFDGPPEVVAIMRRACFDCHTTRPGGPFTPALRRDRGSWRAMSTTGAITSTFQNG